MLQLKRGDILRAEAEALVNTVNCVGVMGRGIALQFRKAFPGNFKAYAEACERGDVTPGKMFVHDLRRVLNPRYIINFPTKRHWRGKSRLEDIESGLEALVAEVSRRGIRSIAIPPLGCGLGGLKWEDVRPRIERAFEAVPEVEVQLFEPAGAPAPEKMVRERSAPRMTQGRAALLGLMRRYLAAVMDPTVSLLEMHKLMYFMQEAGEPLRLRYEEGPYGPYAKNLRHVLIEMEGHYTTGYGDGADRPDKVIDVLPGAWDQAEAFLADHPETREHFERVAELIAGFETPFGMELLATVHWVAREGAEDLEQATARTWQWNDRKKMFTAGQIRTAWETLDEQGWLVNVASPV